MKKFIVLAILAAFIGVISCNTNPPVVPQSYEQRLTEIFDYWPYTVGDSLAYVNENGDSIIFNVITDTIIFYYTPSFDPERDTDGHWVSYDYVDYIFICESHRNYLNLDNLRMGTEIDYINKMYGHIGNICKTRGLPSLDLMGESLITNDSILNQKLFDEFYADSVRLRRSAPNSPETNYIEEYGDLIRGKGIVRWTDMDGHQWRLVDLMHRE